MADIDEDGNVDWKARAKASGFPAFPVAIRKNPQTNKFDKIPMVAGWTKNAYYPEDWPDEVWARAQGYGVPTGAVSGLYVLDVDDYKPGSEGDIWLRQHNLPRTAERDTISGGRHLVYKLSKQNHNTPNRAGIVSGLDGRGQGGYFVGEGGVGSFHYKPIEGDLAELPDAVCDTLVAGWNGGVTSTSALAVPQINENERQRLRELVTNHPEVKKALTNGKNDGSEQLFHVAGACSRAGINRDDFAGIIALSDKSAAHAHVFKHFDQHMQERALGRAWDRANPTGKAEFEGQKIDDAAAIAPSAKKSELEDLFGAEAVERAEIKRELGPFQQRMKDVMITVDDLAGIDFSKGFPAILKGLIPEQGFGVVYGASGIGKSFVTLDLILRLAQGKSWHGHRNKARQGMWVYVSSEGGMMEAKRRLSGWQMKNGGLPKNVVTLAYDFGIEADAEDVRNIVRWCRGLGVPVRGLVLDTLNKNMMPGADESSTKDMTGFVRGVDQIWRALDCFVWVVHHEGKDAEKGARGSSALRGASDVEWRVRREPNYQVGGVSVEKNRNGPDGQDFGFELEKVVLGVDEDGDEVSTLVVKPARPPVSAKAATRKYAKCIAEAYDSIVDPTGNGWVDQQAVFKEAQDVFSKDYPKDRVPAPSAFKRELEEQMVPKLGWEVIDSYLKSPQWEQNDE